MLSRLIARTLRHQGHKYTLRLEPEFWAALEEIATCRDVPLGELLAPADHDGQSHTGAVRVRALQFFRNALHKADGSAAKAGPAHTSF